MIAAAVLVAVHVATTTVDAFGDLRPHNRAQRLDWFYRYGFHTNENDGAELEPRSRRQSHRPPVDHEGFAGGDSRSKGKVLKFVAWIDHPDADLRPVHIKVWADSMLVYEGDSSARRR